MRKLSLALVALAGLAAAPAAFAAPAAAAVEQSPWPGHHGTERDAEEAMVAATGKVTLDELGAAVVAAPGRVGAVAAA